MKITNIPLIGWSMLLACVMIFPNSQAWGYRPFVSTDAAVADLKEVEIELGYFTLERDDNENTFIAPQLVLNYGIAENLEIVGEFEVEKPPDEHVQLIDPALSLKTILKEGTLQEENGFSFAAEVSLLLPSTDQEEKNPGFEA